MRLPDPAEGRSDFVDPDPVLPIINATAGSLMILMVLASAMLAVSILPIIVSLVDSVPSGPEKAFLALSRLFGVRPGATSYQSFRLASIVASIAVFVFVYIPFALRTFWLGFGRLARALLQWRNASNPDGIPYLADPLAVLRKMGAREKYSNDWKDRSAVAMFGLNLQYLSPVATEVAEVIAGRVSSWGARFARIVVGSLAVGSLVAVARVTDVVAAVLRSDLWVTLYVSMWPFLLMGVLTLLVIILEYSFVALLIPRRSWPAESLTEADRVVASTPPNLITHEFPLRLGRYRSPDGPNSNYELSNEVAATSVSETGNFLLIGLIERQPQFIDNPHRAASLFWLISGWILNLGGLTVLLFFLIPSVVREAIMDGRLPEAVYSLTPIVQVGLIALAIQASSDGRRMVAEAERMFRSYWFISSAIGYQFRGTTSRSEINVGRGQTDSIHTSSTVYRSEFLYNLTATTFFSEASTIDGPRRAIGMENTSESEYLLKAGVYELQRIIETRAAPIRVDMVHDGVREQVEANIAIDGMKAARTESMRLQARREDQGQSLGPPKHHPRLTDHSSDDET